MRTSSRCTRRSTSARAFGAASTATGCSTATGSSPLPWAGVGLPVPAAYIGGTKDPVLHFPGFRTAAEAMGPATGGPDALILDDAGHWVQAERPDQVTAAILAFTAGLPS